MKKEWITPQLTIHGNVEKITQQDKDFGGDDGLTLLGQVIGNAS